MLALQHTAPGRPEIIETDDPAPGDGEILVKIEAVATCPHWDLHILADEPMFPGHQIHYPYSIGQPGHEAVGRIAAAGAGVDGLAAGDRVVMWRDRGHNLQGCYAQFVAARPEDVLRAPDDLPDEKLVSLELGMCVQVSLNQLERAGQVEGKRLAVSGLGPAGLVAVQLAKAMGAASVTGIDPIPERRALATQLGADEVLGPGSPELPDRRSAANAFDAAIDCTGLPASIESLMDKTRRVVAIFGVLREEVRFGFKHWSGLSLLGYEPHNRPAAEQALARICAGELDLSPLISAVLPLTRYLEGIEMLKAKRGLKVCFKPWS